MNTKGISTHVLDLARGKPAPGVPVHLEREQSSGEWISLATAQTDADGRCAQLFSSGEAPEPGVYRMVFETAGYHAEQQIDSLYPRVEIVFHVREGDARFHIPLLLSPNGYTTYRGS
jgi:5-hydroxyisourate hydrolase